MSNRKLWIFASVLVIVFLIIAAKFHMVKPVNLFVTNGEVKLNILATADLHGGIPVKLAAYIQGERDKDKNLILVDAGDFYDVDNNDNSSLAMRQWFKIYHNNANLQRRMCPMVRAMDKLRYDAVVLGNHEFVSNDKNSLDALILDFTDCNIPVLSANLYASAGSYDFNYVNPYIIKDIETEQGIVKVGILGLTIKEVGESDDQRELKDLPQYKGTLELRDIVQQVNSKMWSTIMRHNGADIVIAVVHSGEECKAIRDQGMIE